MIPSQMLKGTLEGCILLIIHNKTTYGYEIAQQLEAYGFGKIAEGTIYPLLLRLEKNGYVHIEYHQSEIGPKRKYYRLSEKGIAECHLFIKNYQSLSSAVTALIKNTQEVNK